MSEQGGQNGFPELLTESELIEFLRVPLVSRAENPHHVIEHLRRMRGLPCVHICRQPLFWKPAIRDWLQQQVEAGQ